MREDLGNKKKRQRRKVKMGRKEKSKIKKDGGLTRDLHTLEHKKI